MAVLCREGGDWANSIRTPVLDRALEDLKRQRREYGVGVLFGEDKAPEIWMVRGTCAQGNLASMSRTVFTLYYHMHGRL